MPDINGKDKCQIHMPKKSLTPVRSFGVRARTRRKLVNQNAQVGSVSRKNQTQTDPKETERKLEQTKTELKRNKAKARPKLS